MSDVGTRLTDEQLEFKRAWSQKAGELSAWKGAAALVMARATRYYAAGQDKLADALRDAARELEQARDNTSAELDVFIRESRTK